MDMSDFINVIVNVVINEFTADQKRHSHVSMAQAWGAPKWNIRKYVTAG